MAVVKTEIARVFERRYEVHRDRTQRLWCLEESTVSARGGDATLVAVWAAPSLAEVYRIAKQRITHQCLEPGELTLIEGGAPASVGEKACASGIE